MKLSVNIRYCCFILGLFLYNIFGYTENKLDLGQGRMNVGGSFSIPMYYDRHQDFGLRLKFSPYYGYFIKDNWELRSGFSIDYKKVLSKDPNYVMPPFFWSLYMDTIYYFPLNDYLHFYAGIGLGWEMMDLEMFSSQILIDLPVGLLIALDKNFSIDVGIPIKWHVSVRSAFEKIKFPLGYLGIRYVF